MCVWQIVGVPKKIVCEQINSIYHSIKIVSLSFLLDTELSLRTLGNMVYVVEKAKLLETNLC